MFKFLSMFFMLIMLSNTIRTQSGDFEQITLQLSNPSRPGILELEHHKGSIEITGYDGDVIIIKARLRNPASIIPNKGLKWLSSHSVQLKAEEKNNLVSIHTNSMQKTIDLEIQLPLKFSLRVKNYDNGDVIVQRLQGEMDISNINGNITLNSVSGSAVLNSVDGDLIVQFTDVSSNTPMAFTTVDGKLDISFPQNINALLKLKSDNGEIFTDEALGFEKRELHKHSSPGISSHEVFLEDYAICKLNDGGPEILCRSFNGNIFIRFVKK